MGAVVVLTVLIFCALTGTGSALSPIDLDRIAPEVPENVALLENEHQSVARVP